LGTEAGKGWTKLPPNSAFEWCVIPPKETATREGRWDKSVLTKKTRPGSGRGVNVKKKKKVKRDRAGVRVAGTKGWTRP